jgi:predicted DNA-binding transcriptional regulator AlpA
MIGKEVIGWKELKKLGWPYSRSHTWRMMNEGKFVKSFKLGDFHNSHPVWWLQEVLVWLDEQQSATDGS